MEQLFIYLGFYFPNEDTTFFQILLSVQLMVSIFVLICSVRPLPYGRHDNNQFIKIIKNPKLSWLIMEAPSFLIPLYVIHYSTPRNLTYFSTNIIFLIPFMLHYFHRAFIYSMKIRTSSMPILTIILAVCYTSFNGYLQSSFMLALTDLHLSNAGFIRYVIGMCIFFLGMYINMHADYYLIEMSKNKKQKGQYFIPRGFLFEFISCPNFFGESLEWLGYAIATWTVCGWLFFIQTSLTILPRGYHHHKFYKQKFEDYPPQRKAVIPFVL